MTVIEVAAGLDSQLAVETLINLSLVDPDGGRQVHRLIDARVLPGRPVDPEEVVPEQVRDDQPGHGSEHRRERNRRNDRKQQLAEAPCQQRRRHVAVCRVKRAAGHCPQSHVQRQHIKKSNAGDADDRALPRCRLVLHRVIPNQNMRQRRRPAEQRDHQRQKIQLLPPVVAANT